eukprot:gene6751-4301_t
MGGVRRAKCRGQKFCGHRCCGLGPAVNLLLAKCCGQIAVGKLLSVGKLPCGTLRMANCSGCNAEGQSAVDKFFWVIRFSTIWRGTGAVRTPSLLNPLRSDEWVAELAAGDLCQPKRCFRSVRGALPSRLSSRELQSRWCTGYCLWLSLRLHRTAEGAMVSVFRSVLPFSQCAQGLSVSLIPPGGGQDDRCNARVLSSDEGSAFVRWEAMVGRNAAAEQRVRKEWWDDGGRAQMGRRIDGAWWDDSSFITTAVPADEAQRAQIEEHGRFELFERLSGTLDSESALVPERFSHRRRLSFDAFAAVDHTYVTWSDTAKPVGSSSVELQTRIEKNKQSRNAARQMERRRRNAA